MASERAGSGAGCGRGDDRRLLSVTTVDRVSEELRLRPRVAVIAGLGGLLLFASMILQTAGPQAKVSELTVQLLVTNRRAGLEIVSAVSDGLGLLGLAATLAFLYSAVKARKPEISSITRVTLMVGAVLAAVGGIAYGIVITSKAHQFATQGLQTYPEADNLLRTGPVAVLQYGGLIGSLLLAVSFVLIALNAMRVGLLTKFSGYIGMAAAAASLLLVGSAPALLIEVFWLLSTAVLLAGRWPSGDPPAWKTGQAVPWPSSAELREQRLAARGQGRQGRQAPKRDQRRPAQVPAGTGNGSSPTSPSSAAAKRKRKRRK
jgi:hypothetical protein